MLLNEHGFGKHHVIFTLPSPVEALYHLWGNSCRGMIWTWTKFEYQIRHLRQVGRGKEYDGDKESIKHAGKECRLNCPTESNPSVADIDWNKAERRKLSASLME